jgi:hypothetical protein
MVGPVAGVRGGIVREVAGVVRRCAGVGGGMVGPAGVGGMVGQPTAGVGGGICAAGVGAGMVRLPSMSKPCAPPAGAGNANAQVPYTAKWPLKPARSCTDA